MALTFHPLHLNIWELQGGLSVIWVNDRSIFANKTVTKLFMYAKNYEV